MAVSGISGTGITGMLGNGQAAVQQAQREGDAAKFSALIDSLRAQGEGAQKAPLTGVSSSQVSSNHRLTGDYTQGFYNYYTSEADRNAAPEGFAAGTRTSAGTTPVIDRTSELYAQSKELENYMVKMMLSAARKTIPDGGLLGGDSYAREMYQDMLYDNYAEQLTKNAHLGLADQIYIELSGQR